MERKINFAIVGCGRIAHRHAEHIAKYGNLVAVCDIVEEKADDIAGKHEAKAYYTIEAMLEGEENIDVVSICSPNGLHAEHSIKSLQAGCHVLCEKPMAINAHDCGEMMKASERANRRLFIVKQNRFNPPVEAVKQLLDEGKLGKIYSFQLSCFWNRGPHYYKNSWKGTADLDGGTLYTQFSHFLDLLYWMFGDMKEAKVFAENFAHEGVIDFEDTGAIIMKFHGGTIGTVNYTVNAYSKNMEGSLTIFGEKGSVKIGGQFLNELEYQDIEGYEIKNLKAGNKPNNYGHYVGSMSNHGEVYQNVVDVLNNDAPITTNSFEGLKVVEMIDAIYDQIR